MSTTQAVDLDKNSESTDTSANEPTHIVVHGDIIIRQATDGQTELFTAPPAAATPAEVASPQQSVKEVHISGNWMIAWLGFVVLTVFTLALAIWYQPYHDWFESINDYGASGADVVLGIMAFFWHLVSSIISVILVVVGIVLLADSHIVTLGTSTPTQTPEPATETTLE